MRMLGSEINLPLAGLPPLALDPAGGQGASTGERDPLEGAVEIIGALGQLAQQVGSAASQGKSQAPPPPPKILGIDQTYVAIGAAVVGVVVVGWFLLKK